MTTVKLCDFCGKEAFGEFRIRIDKKEKRPEGAVGYQSDICEDCFNKAITVLFEIQEKREKEHGK
jgi:hypothetical protein